jgi:hypothetical protein
MLYETGYQGNFNPAQAVTIAISTTTSPAVDCGGFVLCGIQLPAVLTGTAISFLASADGVTYQPLFNTTTGTLLSYTVTEATFQAINPQDFQGVNYFKIVSNETEVAARTFHCALRGF